MAISLDDVADFRDKARARVRHTGKDVSAWVDDTADAFNDRGSWLQLAGAAAAGFAAGVAVLGARKVGMQATTAIAGDWLRQLKAEHRLAETLFELGLKTKDHETGRRTLILAHLAYALVKHGLQEEMVIYPALRDDGQTTEAKTLAAEHFDIKTYLHELAEMRKDDPQWIKTWAEFYTLIKHHVREEEEETFPPFHERLSKRQNWRRTRAMNCEGIKLA